MGFDKLLSKLEESMARQVGGALQKLSARQPAKRQPAGSRQRVSPTKIGVRAVRSKVRPVAISGSVPFWQMRGYRPIPSSLPGVHAWRGPLVTRYGQVIAEIESAYQGQYRIFIVNLPAHLHGHPCLPKSGRRWEMHVHGNFHGLDHVIFAAERELGHHWNWHQ